MGRIRSCWAAVVSGLAQDARAGARGLRRSPGFALTAIATVAVGVGMNAAVFTLANTIFFKGFPGVARNDRILYITGPRGQGDVSYPDFEDWRDQARSFQDVGAVADLKVALGDDVGHPVERRDATRVTANVFRLLGQRPVVGRDFTPADALPGAPPVAILNYGFWNERYAADPAAIGRFIRLDGTPTTIVGVMPQGLSFPQKVDLWVPLTPTPQIRRREARGLWFAFGRLADGAAREGAAAELATIARRLASAYPDTNTGAPPIVSAFDEFFVGPNARRMYGSLLGAVGLVLLIACANLGNLTLARAVDRSGEFSVRMALGADRWRIVRQLLVESLMLSILGGAAGWVIARWSLRSYEALASPPEWFDHVLDYSMDARVFLFLTAISVAAGILVGLAPAWRLSALQVWTALKHGGRGATGAPRGRHWSSLLITGEMALAILLLGAAGVMIRSFLKVYTAELGVQADRMSIALINLPDSRYPGAEKQTAFFDRLTTNLEAQSGVEAAAVATGYPAGGVPQRLYDVEGASPVLSIDDARRPRIGWLAVSSDYFRAAGAPILSGRSFTAADSASGLPAVIVNQRFARTHWPNEDPIGKRLRLFDGKTAGEWRTVVGVAPDIVQNTRVLQTFDPLVYVPYRQAPRGDMWILLRTRVPPAGLASLVRVEAQAIDPQLPIWLGPYPLTERVGRLYADKARYGVLLGLFSAIALLLAAGGLYAVTAHSVSRRTREIGVRMALGAGRREVVGLVLRDGMAPVAAGLAIGLAASAGVNQILRSELVQVSPADPATLLTASAALIAAALLGCILPARRASRIDPVAALASE